MTKSSKCGCEHAFNLRVNVGDEDYVDDKDCLLPEAVALIREMKLRLENHGHVAVPKKAEAFLEKVGHEEK